MALLDSLLGSTPDEKDRPVEVLSWLVALNALIALMLLALAQALKLPANFGIEDWLGWHNPALIGGALQLWDGGLSRLPAADAYLLIDTACFMPVYGLTLLWATRHLFDALDPNPVQPMGSVIRFARGLAVPALFALWAVDAVENLGGLTRLGLPAYWGAAALLLAGLVGWALRSWAGGRAPLWPWLAGWLALALLATWQADRGAWAHQHKMLFLGVAVLPLGLAALSWWFGLDLDSRPGSPHAAAAEFRAACRLGTLSVIGRSRYVLAVLVLFGAFTLMLDQCRDVLLALAWPDPDKLTLGGWLWWGAQVVLGAFALSMLAYACWLWTRLVGRVKRTGFALPGLPGLADWVGAWARSWARMLMLAPLVMTATLVALVVGDAVIAAGPHATANPQAAGQQLLFSLAVLVVFMALNIWLTLRLMAKRREHSLKRMASYYNASANVRRLLLTVAPAREGRWPNRLLALPARPIWQPLAALALLLFVRGLALLMPEVGGQVPAALAVLALSLVWWLGPLGLIAMSEQRAVLPWALVLLALAGVVALASDNHVLPALVMDKPEQVPGVLAGLRAVALAALAWLALVSALLWTLLALRSRTLLGLLRRDLHRPQAQLDVTADWSRLGLGLLAVLVLCGGLQLIDGWAARAMPEPAAPPQAAVATAPPMPPGPLLIVASEGGGVRAAYWTARVLAGLQDAHPGWASRIVAMSGVSGGSMGIAVWRACARGDRGTTGTITGCVEQRFRDLDALTPLLGGLLFEDVWMRLLPTDWLCGPASGCGMRSRAMGFEREWMRAFPHLAAPLGHALPGEPELLFNSTVVESGNRALLGTLEPQRDDLPGAEDLLASGRVASMPALVTAAHTSARFPFINPLASLPNHGTGLASAHLADGGYHDNSGTASLADLLGRWRKTNPERRLQLVLIRNGQVPAGCLPQALAETKAEPPADCLAARSDASELLPPRDARRLKLFADLFGPAVAAINNLGTAAHGREPVAALTAQLSAAPGSSPLAGPGCAASSPVCLLDQMEDGSLVPLGWTLSPAARAAMNAQAVTLTQQLGPAMK